MSCTKESTQSAETYERSDDTYSFRRPSFKEKEKNGGVVVVSRQASCNSNEMIGLVQNRKKQNLRFGELFDLRFLLETRRTMYESLRLLLRHISK